MRFGIFSDIHGNIYAFERVWKKLRDESCDLHFFLGDICGYYYHQNEVIDLLRGIKELNAVRGNHDEMFLTSRGDSEPADRYEARYGKANRLLYGRIREDNLEFLRRLPDKLVLKEHGILLVHGCPSDRLNGYVYPDTELGGLVPEGFQTVLLGHTHYAMDRVAGATRVINPGSCGQPRDMSTASYAVFDTETGKTRFERVEYDCTELIREIGGMGETNRYLSDVLMRKARK